MLQIKQSRNIEQLLILKICYKKECQGRLYSQTLASCLIGVVFSTTGNDSHIPLYLPFTSPLELRGGCVQTTFLALYYAQGLATSAKILNFEVF